MVNKPNIENSLRAIVDAFVAEVSAIVHQSALESIRAAIDQSSGARPASRARAARPAPSTAASATPGRRGRKPSPESEKAAGMLLTYVQSNPGQRLEEIGVGLGTSTKGLKGPIARLVRDGQLRTEGQRRGTRYHPGSGKPARRKAAKKRGRKGKRRGGRR